MEKQLSPIIQGLMPSLMERGKIKIGRRGELVESQNQKQFQLPKKLNHFIITTMERGADNNFLKDEALHKLIGQTPQSIPIMLIYDKIPLNFRCSYARYHGRTLMCRGDGINAYQLTQDYTRKLRECPCEKADPKYDKTDKCKKNGSLSCMITGAPGVGGVWRFRTTSHNSIVGILSALVLIKRLTGGALAGIPLKLVIAPKTVTNPVNQRLQTVYVVNIEFAGTIQQLREQGFKALLDAKTHDMKVHNIEQEASRLLEYTPAKVIDADESAEDITDEFYPEQAAEAEGAEIQDETGDAPALQEPDAPPPPEKPPAPPQSEPPKKDPDKPPAQQKKTRGRKPKNTAPPAPPAPPKQEPPKTVPEPDKSPDLVEPDQSGQENLDVF